MGTLQTTPHGLKHPGLGGCSRLLLAAKLNQRMNLGEELWLLFDNKGEETGLLPWVLGCCSGLWGLLLVPCWSWHHPGPGTLWPLSHAGGCSLGLEPRAAINRAGSVKSGAVQMGHPQSVRSPLAQVFSEPSSRGTLRTFSWASAKRPSWMEESHGEALDGPGVSSAHKYALEPLSEDG